jgi:hypothetical protein
VHEKGIHVEEDLDRNVEFLESTDQVENSNLNATYLPDPKVAFRNG